MNWQPFSVLNKPEYLFRPSQVARRLQRLCRAQPTDFAEAVLPWGLKIKFHPQELIGASIWRMGLYDLCVSEAIWRLLDPGECALDIGANIGHMTSVMAACVGPAGIVICFEPHPEIFKTLAANVDKWGHMRTAGRISARPVALSDQAGAAVLNIADNFEANQGGSYLATNDGTRPPASSNLRSRTVSVETQRLDDLVGAESQVSLAKIDVEGHEIAVLEGAARLFGHQQIRDVIFEEHRNYPTPVTIFLESRGYILFRVSKGFLGLTVKPAKEAEDVIVGGYDAPNYLATTKPDRALARLQKRGWAVLGMRHW